MQFNYTGETSESNLNEINFDCVEIKDIEKWKLCHQLKRHSWFNLCNFQWWAPLTTKLSSLKCQMISQKINYSFNLYGKKCQHLLYYIFLISNYSTYSFSSTSDILIRCNSSISCNLAGWRADIALLAFCLVKKVVKK